MLGGSLFILAALGSGLAATLFGLVGAICAGLALLIVVALAKPHWLVIALPLIIAAAALTPDTSGLAARIYPGIVAIAVLSLIGGQLALRDWPTFRKASSKTWPLWVLAGVSMASALYAFALPDPGVLYAFPASGVGHGATVVIESFLVLATAALTPTVAIVVRDRREVRLALYSCLLATTALIIMASVSFAQGTGVSVVAGTLRPTAGQLDGAALGVVVALAWPAGLWLCLSTGAPASRTLRVCVLGILLLGTVLSFSRVTWVAVPIEVLLFLTLTSPRLAWTGVVLLLTIGAAAAVQLIDIDGVAKYFDPHRAYGFERLRIWGDAWNIYLTHPILGVGAGNFQFYDRSLNVDIVGAGVSHNQFLTTLAESGPLGLIALLLVPAYIVKWLLAQLGSSGSAEGRLLAVVGLSATLGMVVFSFAGDTFAVSAAAGGGSLRLSLYSFYWLLIGLIVAQHRITSAAPGDPGGRAVRRIN